MRDIVMCVSARLVCACVCAYVCACVCACAGGCGGAGGVHVHACARAFF